jgi:hypothetical protein
MEKGYRRYDFCQGIEDENRLFLLEEFETKKTRTDLNEDRLFNEKGDA